jgi:hypothetical protein
MTACINGIPTYLIKHLHISRGTMYNLAINITFIYSTNNYINTTNCTIIQFNIAFLLILSLPSCHFTRFFSLQNSARNFCFPYPTCMASLLYFCWLNYLKSTGWAGQIAKSFLLQYYKFLVHFIVQKLVTMFIMFKRFFCFGFLVRSYSLIYYRLNNSPLQTNVLQNTTKVEYTNQQNRAFSPTSAFLFVSRFLPSVCRFTRRRWIGVASNKEPPTLGVWSQTATHFLSMKLSLSIPPTCPYKKLAVADNIFWSLF